MKFEYLRRDDWPPLAWWARCSRSSPTIRVFHGAGVETRPEWFCEAVWKGPFDAGDFDGTDIVSGSGARCRNGRVVFVSSGSTVDRLQSLEEGDGYSVSNSLACLARQTGAEVDPAYPGYYRDFYSIVEGIDHFLPKLETSRGPVRLTYYRNLEWSPRGLTEIPKPIHSASWPDFESYADFLRSTMEQVARNAQDPGRRRPYGLLSTLSSGYDSTTVSTLARQAGCRHAVSFDRDFRGLEDSGREAAEVLDIEIVLVSDSEWRRAKKPEIPFLAANSMGEEVRFKAAEASLTGKVLFTGYHGDKVWAKNTKFLGPDIVRGDPSGLGLTEYRLWAGFIHCAVAFWGVRRIAELHAISNSPTMRAWDAGGDYSRPICRRICESAGVPRDAFGIHKRNASVILHNYDEFLTPDSRADYFEWLRDKRGTWYRSKRIPPMPNDFLDRVAYQASGSLARGLRKMPYLWRWAHSLDGGPVYLRRYVFPWALERAKLRYADDTG